MSSFRFASCVAFVYLRKGEPLDQRRRLVASVFAAPPSNPVGEFKYSSIGYAIVGAMVEAVFHESWTTLIRDSLARPLGIDAHFGWPAHENAQQPWGHTLAKGQLRPQKPGPFWPPLVDPAGAISLSISDFARWVQFNLRGLTGTDGLVRAATMETLHAPRGMYAMGWMHPPAPTASFTLDCVDAIFGSAERQSWHNGSPGSFVRDARILPDRRLAVAVMINAASPTTAAAVEEICKGVLAPRAPTGR